MLAGFQVPGIPFVEVDGSRGAAEFWHNDPIRANRGLTRAFMVIVSVAAVAH